MQKALNLTSIHNEDGSDQVAVRLTEGTPCARCDDCDNCEQCHRYNSSNRPRYSLHHTLALFSNIINLRIDWETSAAVTFPLE
jgi:hypothetical protein